MLQPQTSKEMSLNRPMWFSIVAILFALIGMGSIVTGVEFSASYGSVSGGLCFIYGLSAWAVAISLWMCKPWAFHAVIIWSISTVLRIFNMQYGMKGDGTLPTHLFIPWVLLWITISIGLLYYVKQAFRKTKTDAIETSSKQGAIELLNKGNELYAWPEAYESDDAFAFVVIYKGREKGWWVALHYKLVDYENIKYYIEIDALACKSEEQKNLFPTPEAAIDFAISKYNIQEFVDYKAISSRYKTKYTK